LVSLEELDLADNCLFLVPAALFAKMNKLKTLRLSDNLIKKFLFESSFAPSKSLAFLNLSNNNIEKFSIGPLKLQNLTHLDLSANGLLKEFQLVAEQRLVYLNLNYNSRMKFTALSESLGLRYLHLRSVLSGTLDRANLSLVPDLLELDLSFNRLFDFSNLLGYKNAKLERLHLEGVQASFDLGFLTVNFPSLLEINVGSCRNLNNLDQDLFARLPPNITHITLSSLSLDSRSIENRSFPDWQHLDLSNNQIERLPEQIFATNKLNSLNLAHNRLTKFNFDKVSKRVNKKLMNLAMINLAFNNISEVSSSVSEQDTPIVGHIYLNGNNLESIDQKVAYLFLMAGSVDLSSNRIKLFQKYDVSVWCSTFVSLSMNALDALSNKMFESSLGFRSNTVHLDLSMNQIRYVNKSVFREFIK
jgi:Leucine-rich repeat (LRR) protein